MANEVEKQKQVPSKLSDEARLDYLNAHFDDFDNLIDLKSPIENQTLPQDEDEMIKYHLARNVVRTDQDIDSFFSDSQKSLGFKIENGKAVINGATPQIEGQTLEAYLKANLVKNAAKAGFEDTENSAERHSPTTTSQSNDADAAYQPTETTSSTLTTNESSQQDASLDTYLQQTNDQKPQQPATKTKIKKTKTSNIQARQLAGNILDELAKAKSDFAFLKANYESASELKAELVKVATLREMAKIQKDYDKGKTNVMAHTKIETNTLAFETRVEIVKTYASNATEAALLWYAINFNPDMNYEHLDIYKIFDKKNIDKNGIAIVNGRLVVAYKPNNKKLPDGVNYEYATYGYGENSLNPAIQNLRSKHNEFGGRKGEEIADTLENGVKIYEGILKETKGTMASYETNDVFQQNYDLLQRIMLIPEGMLNSEIGLEGNEEAGLPKIENLPEFTKEGGPWYFGQVGGKFYARTIHFIEKGNCYAFDMAKGWEKTDTIPTMQYAMPELYTEQKDGKWEINQNAIAMVSSLSLNPNMVLTRTLNVLHEKTKRNAKARSSLLDSFGFDTIPGLTIPFPRLNNVEVMLDSEHYNDSLKNIQDILHTAYVEAFPGLNYDAAHWLADDIGERFLKTLSLKDQNGKPYVVDQNGKELDKEHKYILSNSTGVANFTDAFRPQVEYTAEKKFSDETQARIDKINKYIKDMYTGFFGKLTDLLGSKLGVVGATIAQFAKEYAKQPLGDVHKLSEELSEEWEAMEKEKGTTLSFKDFMVAYGAQALWKLKDPKAKIEEDSFLGRIKKLFTGSGASATPEAAAAATQQPEQQRSPLDVTDKAQLKIFASDLDALKYSFGQKRGQNLFTPDEITTMVIEAGDTKDTSFTNREQNEFKIRKIKAKLDALSGDEKTAFQTEYDFLVEGKIPAEYAAAQAAAQTQTETAAAPEIASGQPGDSVDNPIDLNGINTDAPYNGWCSASKDITVTSGRLTIPDVKFDDNAYDNKFKIEIKYKDAKTNTHDPLTDKDGKIDTFDNSQFAAMEQLLEVNGNNLKIGGENTSQRVSSINGEITHRDASIESITIKRGVRLNSPHLYKQ